MRLDHITFCIKKLIFLSPGSFFNLKRQVFGFKGHSLDTIGGKTAKKYIYYLGHFYPRNIFQLLMHDQGDFNNISTEPGKSVQTDTEYV